MTTIQMCYFIETAKRLNFTAAAESLYVTQPTLSRQIISMEQELNVTLFIREKNAVTLTPAGQTLYLGLQKVYGSYTELVKNVTKVQQGFSGNLRIALAEDQVISKCFKSAIRKFHLNCPDINITIEKCALHTIRADLLEGRFDIINTILLGEHFFKDLKTILLSEEKGYFAIEKSFPANEDETLSSEECIQLFHDYPFILPIINNIPGSHYDSLTMWFYNNGIPQQPVSVKYLEDLTGLSELVSLGLGVAFVNKTHSLSADNQVKLLKTDLLERYKKIVIYNPLNPNPILYKFLDYMEAVIPRSPESQDNQTRSLQ
ncbi:MAG: LysR family transcriptional regulator [Lachnospiraceae bacterium]